MQTLLRIFGFAELELGELALVACQLDVLDSLEPDLGVRRGLHQLEAEYFSSYGLLLLAAFIVVG